MDRRSVKLCCATAVTLALLCGGRAFAADDSLPPAPEASSHPAAKSHARPAKRPRKVAQPAKVEDKKAAAKAQPWFDVDPGRAVRPPDPTQTAAEAKPAAPTAKWERDRFDFDTKMTGSNDFRQLPRFDANENPQGLGAQTGINLHF